MLSFYKEKANNGPGRNDDDNKKKEEKKDKNTLSKEGKIVGYNLTAFRVRVKFKDKKMVMDIGMNLAPGIKRWGIIVW